MRPHLPLLLELFAAVFACAGAPSARAQGTPIGFEEAFALAPDRTVALEQLIPGTRDYYYYQCLQRLNSGALDEVDALLRLWIQRYGRTARVRQIENRRALLSYEGDPRGTFAFLRKRLGLRYDHRPEVPGDERDLPARLDQALISRAALMRRALARHPRTLEGLRDSALSFVNTAALDTGRLHRLLGRLKRPDFPNLPALIVRDLEVGRGRRFGSLAIHRKLLLDQLEECLQLRPALLGEDAFIAAYLRRLRPGADVDWRFDADARRAYLERLEAFTQRLSPAQNSLKAHVLYHLLVDERTRGRYDKKRFLAYLRLPRRAGYVNPDYLKRRVSASQLVDQRKKYPSDLEPIADDEALVRAYLMHFFRSEDSYAPYAEYVRSDYLKRLFAETKILYGQGDMERWYSLLDDPAYYEALKERVEIEFAPEQRSYYRASEPVGIDVDLKNVGTLLVKVFAINTFNFYREQHKEIDASINLDGLIANEEKTHTYEENPLRRVRRHFEFPALNGPGVYVIEFIGNGMSSRAVIHKGRLQMIERSGSAGHVLRVLDEGGRFLSDASVWLAGHEYRADEHGEIVVPYSTRPGSQPILLRHGELTTLANLEHRAEKYELQVAVYLEREELLARAKARILVRPSLLVNGRAASIELLEEPVLTITSRDQRGITATQDVRALELSGERELVHEIQVPPELSSLSVRLKGRVRNLSRGEEKALTSNARTFHLNAIEATSQTSCALLGRSQEGYLLDVLGKNGEPRPGRVIHIELLHRDFADAIEVDLKTDAHGRIHLGALAGIASLRASALPKGIGAWELRPVARTYPRTFCGTSGKSLAIPYQGSATSISRAVVSLLELRAGAFARDFFDHVALRGGFLELRDLPAGDYDLWLKEADHHASVKISAGEETSGWFLGRDRLLPAAGSGLLHIGSVAVQGGNLKVQLANAGPEARVHIVATRYLPPFDPFQCLSAPLDPAPAAVGVLHPDSSYHSGRRIGDEYRYILERRYAKKFPGNMLRRPGLILNPWALEETKTGLGSEGRSGGRFGGRKNARGMGGGAGGSQGGRMSSHPGTFPNLAFLPAPAVLRANLRPDARGLVSVPLADLGAGQLVHILAVDEESTVYTSKTLPEKPLVPRDRRLARAFDPARHFTERKRIELVPGGGQAVIEDLATSRTEPYDSLAAVFRLFRTLGDSADLQEFAFVLRWPELSPKEKRELYSKHACHELHFFLFEKDPKFFAEVIKPYLANKMHKTFLDHWLLGDDLHAYLDPWAFGHLNVVERILLGQRIRGEAEAIGRHVKELCDLLPPNPERWLRLFESALGGSALEEDQGIGGKMAKLRSNLATHGAVPRAPAPASKGRARRAPAEDAANLGEVAVAEEVVEEEAELEDALQVEGKARRLLEKSKKNLALGRDRSRRGRVQQLYRAPAPTREYVEQNYWHRRIEEQNADLIGANPFWNDYAAARGAKPFLSVNVMEATGNFAEMMLALAVLDLPFEAGKHESEVAGARFTLHAASPLLLVRKDLEEAPAPAAKQPFLVRQDYFRLDDRYRYEGNQRYDKFVTSEFLRGIPYGCRVVLTNLTSSPQRLELLNQIPRGSIAVQRGFTTRSVIMSLDPYSTRALEYDFYFPASGTFTHYPVHVARGGEVVAFSEAHQLKVVDKLSEVDTSSWAYLSQRGSSEQVLAFLGRANLERIELDKIAWRMREKSFFTAVIALLRQRHVYSATLWSYALLHEDEAASREFLRGADAFLRSCGPTLASPLVNIDPVERRAYQHIEYEPLFNPRAHRFGKRREILNASLARQYHRLMKILCCRPRLDDEDWMSVTYYLLLQDRIEEALNAFSRVRPEHLAMHLQYDYMRAYLDFFSPEHAIARAIAEKYRDHPVKRWRELFTEVLDELDEAEGKGAAKRESDERERSQGAAAASEPALELAVEARRVKLRYRNLERCQVRYYEMDIEFLFSTHPFVQQEAGSFAYIRPNRTDELRLAADQREVAFDLPQQFRNSNLLVEVQAGPLVRRQAYYANALEVQVIESYGQVRVSHAESGKPLPRAYVKVYERLSGGRVRFHKDGYTDLRGRFDYASLSGPPRERVERYAILVMSESNGSLIREAAPPKE